MQKTPVLYHFGRFQTVVGFRDHAFSESCVTTTVSKAPLELSTLIFALALAEAPDERLHAAADRLAAEAEHRKSGQLEI